MKLSEMKSSPDVGRPEATFPICVSGKLAADLEAADRDLFAAEEEREAARKRGRQSALAAAQKRAKAAAERCDEIRARMEEHTIVLALRGKADGEWRNWTSAHPARDEDEDPQGHKRDARHGGFCNIDDLIETLGEFVAKYGDEDPDPDSWAFIRDNAAGGDLTRLASKVIAMHEQVVDAGKSRVAWLDGRRNVGDSN